MTSKLTLATLLASMVSLVDKLKPMPTTGDKAVEVKKHSSKIHHIFKFLAPTQHSRRSTRMSIYKEHKPLHAPRHIAHR